MPGAYSLFSLLSQDTLEFIRNFQSETPLKRGCVSAQDACLHERVMAQVTQFKPSVFVFSSYSAFLT